MALRGSRVQGVERSFSLNVSNDRAVGMLVGAALTVALVLPSVFFLTQMTRIEAEADLALNCQIAEGASEPDSPVPEVVVLDMPMNGAANLSRAEEELVKVLKSLTNTDIVLAQNNIQHLRRESVDLYYFIRPIKDDGSSYRVYYSDVSFAFDVAKSAAAGMAAFSLAFAVLIILLGRKSKLLLQRKDEVLKNFLSDSSHELKTPLAVIASQVEAAQWGAIEVENALKSVRGATERMAGIIDALISMSRLEAGVIQPKMRRHDIREDLYDVIVEMEWLFEEKGIVLALEAAVPAYIKGDKDMLFSIFQNILSNALRYAASSVGVVVSACGEEVVVGVTNDGTAVSEDEACFMFDRFATGRGGKTGIGLALAAEYARIHGGSIEAYPLAAGTRVVVTFPSAVVVVLG